MLITFQILSSGMDFTGRCWNLYMLTRKEKVLLENQNPPSYFIPCVINGLAHHNIHYFVYRCIDFSTTYQVRLHWLIVFLQL
ncbi:hypothetical protein GDO81_010018 [Engystomops pustulosus]|uniref:Uncharacterized protein n=1 Tax=Engystomops pustulosus TaxID=76066 RepID=A0AAV7BXA2_ENGPU|nr:hypothetical protein GDO81_010018 [Engystomops pustulosus]